MVTITEVRGRALSGSWKPVFGHQDGWSSFRSDGAEGSVHMVKAWNQEAGAGPDTQVPRATYCRAQQHRHLSLLLRGEELAGHGALGNK